MTAYAPVAASLQERPEPSFENPFSEPHLAGARRVETLEEQSERIMADLHRKSSPLEKYRYLSALQVANETLFYRVVMDNADLQEGRIFPLAARKREVARAVSIAVQQRPTARGARHSHDRQIDGASDPRHVRAAICLGSQT